MDRIIYTNEKTKEELFEELNIMLSQFYRDLYAKEAKETKENESTGL